MDTAELRPSLEAKIQEIKETLDEAAISGTHLNEATTEYIIIDPLLQILGYNPLQIFKRGHDSVANNFPDYTLLPNTPHKWFLEVKKLDLSLQDGEAAQAVNYANNQGAEWAVLTNGRTWYIYNAHLPKPLIEKRVMQTHDLFADADGIETLLLLSRQSMQNEGLKKAWVHERLVAVVKRQLETPNSAVRKHLRKIGSAEIGTALDDAAIGRAIADGGIMSLPPMPTTSTFLPQPMVKISENGLIHPTAYTFEQIARDSTLTTFRKPNQIEFSDGHHEEVHSWADTAKVIVERVGNKYKLPVLPFKTGKGHNYFLNSVAVHGKGNQMLGQRIATIDNQTVYIDTNRGASYLAASIASFLTAAGAPSDAVKVTLASQG